MRKVGAKGFTTVWSPVPIIIDLKILAASQRANVFA